LEWEDAGFRELLTPQAITLIEWPEKASGVLPSPDVRVSLIPESTGRRLVFSAHSARGQQAVEQFLVRSAG
jgi:tRNA threonylcarbamoyladenosine biosynthesis protein TsaE